MKFWNILAIEYKQADMARILLAAICASMWMEVYVSGAGICLTNAYVEHGCFDQDDINNYLYNNGAPSIHKNAQVFCEQVKKCCWNSSIPRCYGKTHVTESSESWQDHNSAIPSESFAQPIQPPQPHYQQPYQAPNQQQMGQQHNQQPYVYPSQQEYRYPHQPSRHYQTPTHTQNRYSHTQQGNYVYSRRRPSQQGQTYQNQHQPQKSTQPPTSSVSTNMKNLFASLGLPNRTPVPVQGIQGQQGALGTNVAASIVKQSTDPLSGINQCSLANGITNEAARAELQKLLGCTGNEPPIEAEEANRLVQGILGSTGGGAAAPAAGNTPAPTAAPKVSPELTFPVLPAASAVGSRLPTYGVQSYRPPPTNARACLLLKSLTSEVAAIMKLRYNCGATGNALIDLASGNSPPGLGSIPSIISLFGVTADAPAVTAFKQGSINPNLIPSDILAKCISQRYTYDSCRSGYNTNINTESECFNVGCLFFRDTYGSRCFRCTLVPASAYRLQDSADTCAVDDQEECDGFKSFQLSVVALDLRGKQSTIATTPAPNPLASLFGNNPLMSALLQSNPGLLGGLGSAASNPLLSLLARSGYASATRQLDTSTLLSLLSGGSSGLLGGTSGLLGGSSSSIGGTNPAILSALLTGGTTGIKIPKLSPAALGHLKSTCETKGCCWAQDAGSQLGGVCHKKGVSFPTGCLPTTESGTCGKSLDISNLQRVVGGVNVNSPTSRPWMAVIKQIVDGSEIFRCGGVQICSQWVLTTASCLQRKDDLKNSYLRVPNINPATIKVYVGTLNPAVPGPEAVVEKIIVHPGYTTLQSYNDIALLRVRSLTFTAANSPVCLPPLATESPADGKVLYFTGYGKNSYSGVADFTSLKELPFTVKSDSFCNTIYPGMVLPQSGVFCAQSFESSDTCYGDGGSPAVAYDAVLNVFTVIGINFAGSDQCDGSKPALFTSIIKFMPWIAQSTNGCCHVPGLRYNF